MTLWHELDLSHLSLQLEYPLSISRSRQLPFFRSVPDSIYHYLIPRYKPATFSLSRVSQYERQICQSARVLPWIIQR